MTIAGGLDRGTSSDKAFSSLVVKLFLLNHIDSPDAVLANQLINPVTVVDKNVDKHGTRKVAEAFVDFLYTTEAQEEFAKLGYRPLNPSVAAEVASKYPQLQTLFTIQDLGGWDDVQKKFFTDGATFDQIQATSKA